MAFVTWRGFELGFKYRSLLVVRVQIWVQWDLTTPDPFLPMSSIYLRLNRLKTDPLSSSTSLAWFSQEARLIFASLGSSEIKMWLQMSGPICLHGIEYKFMVKWFPTMDYLRNGGWCSEVMWKTRHEPHFPRIWFTRKMVGYSFTINRNVIYSIL